MTEITFYVPCLNEEKNIQVSLKTIIQSCKILKIINYEILVFDDGSKDQSVKKIEEFKSNNNLSGIIKIFSNKVSMGLGYNYIEGAYMGEGEYYIMVCGDNSEDQDNLCKVLRERGKADIIVPNFVKNDDRIFFRRILSRFFTYLINILSGNNLKYYNGVVLHRTENVKRWHPLSCGFGYQAELLTNLISIGKTYIEVDIKNIDRTTGISRSLSLLNFLSVFHTLLQIFFRRIRKLIWKI
jgi:dolichol-phosphate mannosyltransferase